METFLILVLGLMGTVVGLALALFVLAGLGFLVEFVFDTCFDGSGELLGVGAIAGMALSIILAVMWYFGTYLLATIRSL